MQTEMSMQAASPAVWMGRNEGRAQGFSRGYAVYTRGRCAGTVALTREIGPLLGRGAKYGEKVSGRAYKERHSVTEDSPGAAYVYILAEGEGVLPSKDPRYLRWQRVGSALYANAPGTDPMREGVRYRVSLDPRGGFAAEATLAETGEGWEPVGTAAGYLDACRLCAAHAAVRGYLEPLAAAS